MRRRSQSVEQFTLTQAGVLRWCLLLFLSIPTLCLSATNEVARTHNAGGGASSNSNFRCISSICQSFPVVYTANGYIESINGRLRDKCLKVHPIFGLNGSSGGELASWRMDYNQVRPYQTLGPSVTSRICRSPRQGPQAYRSRLLPRVA